MQELRRDILKLKKIDKHIKHKVTLNTHLEFPIKLKIWLVF